MEGERKPSIADLELFVYFLDIRLFESMYSLRTKILLVICFLDGFTSEIVFESDEATIRYDEPKGEPADQCC